MIWGCTWDQICRFINQHGDKVSLDNSISYGNYQDSFEPANVDGYGTKQKTGYSEYWKTNNIYDLAGNCNEFSQEAGWDCYRVVCGGSYNDSSRNVTYCVFSGTNSGYHGNSTTRTVLYLK